MMVESGQVCLARGAGVTCLADGEGDVAVLDHVLDLSAHYRVLACCFRLSSNLLELTGQAEEDQPVDDQDRPEDRQVENLEPTAEETDSNSLGRRVPELELWKAAHKGPELLVLLGGKATCVSILHALILL